MSGGRSLRCQYGLSINIYTVGVKWTAIAPAARAEKQSARRTRRHGEGEELA